MRKPALDVVIDESFVAGPNIKSFDYVRNGARIQMADTLEFIG